MRRFEYVEGSSSKFWEIDRDGSSVTVRFGRIGTNGQEQVKDLGTDAAATAHVDKLVAEKVKKGYAEVDGAEPPPRAVATPAAADPVAQPAAPAPVDLPDEDTFEIPAAWRRTAHPRRDRPPVPKVSTGEAAPSKLHAAITANWEQGVPLLTHPNTDRRIAAAAHNPADPLGAGAVALALTEMAGWRIADVIPIFADYWLGTGGMDFALRAMSELAGLYTDRSLNWHQPFLRPITDADADPTNWYQGWHPIARRLRSHVAALPDGEYERAVAVLSEYRGRTIHQRVLASYLVPTQYDWVAADLEVVASRTAPVNAVFLGALNEGAQLAALGDGIPWNTAVRIPGMFETLTIALGPAAAPQLARWFDSGNLEADDRRRLLELLANLPTDEAFGLLLDRVDQKFVQGAVLDAARRFPARALRLLAARTSSSTSGRIIGDLLRGHVRARPEIVDAVLPTLPPAAQARVTAISSVGVLPPAPAGSLPAVLTDPPWIGKRTAAKQTVVEGLQPPAGAAVVWAPGERKEWLDSLAPWYLRRVSDWRATLERFRRGEVNSYDARSLFLVAPDDVARAWLPNWRPDDTFDVTGWAKTLLARHEVFAVPMAVHVARKNAATAAFLLLPVISSEVALLMADWHARSKTVRPIAAKWFERHGGEAARALIPAAVGPSGPPRRTAEGAIRKLVALGHAEAVRTAAAQYGPAAAAAIDDVLAADPLEALPPKIPTVPSWLDVAVLPQVLTADRAHALPSESVKHLVTMLAMSKPGEVYAGVEVARQALDPGSLADFAWAVFAMWAANGFPNASGWVLEAQGLVGNDETVRRLAPMIRVWPGEGGHKRAVTGLDVLAAIGTDVALMHLHGIAQKAKFKGLKDRAGEKIAEIAETLGLTADELADRLVPDLGLDDDGAMTLDYGPRQFRVGFDEALKPFVTENGQRRATLPRPSAKDDAELAPAAYERFSALKKDVRTIAGDQIKRLEQAMVNERRWPATAFRQLFVDHPLLVHIVRRLVWATFDGTVSGFRVAEDRTFASVEDDEITLPDDATVGIAHPLQLADLPSWGEVFADYEILQPFEQLSRQTFALTPADARATALTGFTGRKVKTVKVLSLEHRGWRRGMPQDAGVQAWIYRDLPDGNSFTVPLDPGIIPGMATESGFEEQTLQDAFIASGPGGDWSHRKQAIKLGTLGPVVASEILRDLAWLTT